MAEPNKKPIEVIVMECIDNNRIEGARKYGLPDNATFTAIAQAEIAARLKAKAEAA